MYARNVTATAVVLVATLLPAPALGQQATFDAVLDTIQVPGNTTIGDELTIEASIFIQSALGGVIFDEMRWAKEDKLLSFTPTELHGAAYRGATYPGLLRGDVTWELCEWTHVAFVVEGNEERLYVNGGLIASRTVSGTILDSPFSNMSVGAFDASPGPLRVAIRGSIDWLRVSNAALYSGASATPPASQPPSNSSTLLLYHFDEPSTEVVVVDQGPNGWDGQLGVGVPGGTSPELGALATMGTSYCTAGTSASGCRALLHVDGLASASAAGGFDLVATAVEGNKDGLFFFGTSGRQANPWGNGASFQCVVPPVKRAGLLSASGSNGSCDGLFTQDLNALWQAQPAKNPGAGATVQAQLWYRDPVNTSNQTTSLSGAIEFAVCP